MVQDVHMSYPPIMKLQSLKILNTLLIKRVKHYISITKNRENDLQNITKNLQNNLELMDLHMTFDFAILKLETNKSMKTKNTLKH